MSIVGRTAVVVIGVAAAIQLIRPARTNPPVDPARAIDAHVGVPAAVHAILERSCSDCHSNRTRWPWYSNVAPISWFVINHVQDGRRAFNLDDWTVHSRRRTTPPIDQVCTLVRAGEMPLSSYLQLHKDATLSPADVDALCAWSQSVSGGAGSGLR